MSRDLAVSLIIILDAGQHVVESSPSNFAETRRPPAQAFCVAEQLISGEGGAMFCWGGRVRYKSCFWFGAKKKSLHRGKTIVAPRIIWSSPYDIGLIIGLLLGPQQHSDRFDRKQPNAKIPSTWQPVPRQALWAPQYSTCVILALCTGTCYILGCDSTRTLFFSCWTHMTALCAGRPATHGLLYRSIYHYPYRVSWRILCFGGGS